MSDDFVLPEEHVKVVCQVGQGAKTCAFLARDGRGWMCAKGSVIEQAVRDRIEQGQMGAKGDNCSGPPEFSVNPQVVIQQFCDRHQRDLVVRRFHLRESDPWLTHLVTMQILMFTWLTTDPRILARSDGGKPELLSLVFGEIGCMACFDHDAYLRAITIVRKGISHAAQVAQGKATDPEWPIAERIAALPEKA